jgi:hypothetical protein
MTPGLRISGQEVISLRPPAQDKRTGIVFDAFKGRQAIPPPQALVDALHAHHFGRDCGENTTFRAAPRLKTKKGATVGALQKACAGRLRSAR